MQKKMKETNFLAKKIEIKTRKVLKKGVETFSKRILGEQIERGRFYYEEDNLILSILCLPGLIHQPILLPLLI